MLRKPTALHNESLSGAADDLKGQVPMGLVVLKSGMTITEADLQQQLINRIRDTIGAITCYKDTVILVRLPKARSGKTLRKTLARIVNGKEYLARIVNGKEYRVPSTIDGPGVIPEIIELLHSKKMVK
jgi:propionyl-CoA synthetase